jgi:hypothetical protein
MKSWLAFLMVVLVAGAWVAPKPGAVGAAQGNPPVQMVRPGQRQAANPGEKGATYYALEAQSRQVKTTFHDGHVATSERGFSGVVTTTVHDSAGNERSKMKVLPVDAGHSTVSFQPTEAADPVQMVSDPTVTRPTLDWAAKQAYRLTRDGTKALVWSKGQMRPQAAVSVDPEGEVKEVETVWQDGLVAKVTRGTRPRRELAPGLVLGGRTLETELTRHGVFAGSSVWYEEDKAYLFYVAGLMDKAQVITQKVMADNFGGWTFAPDTAWMNLQLIATHHFKTQVAKNGLVARNDAGGCPSAPAPNRIAQFFFPTVLANEAGCDRLHWLDGSIFRGCCEEHDRCYARAGCTERSWWTVWSSWTCDMCNAEVVWCFYVAADIEYCRTRANPCAG